MNFTTEWTGAPYVAVRISGEDEADGRHVPRCEAPPTEDDQD